MVALLFDANSTPMAYPILRAMVVVFVSEMRWTLAKVCDSEDKSWTAVSSL